MNILVSACLMGICCRYDGKCQSADKLDIEKLKKYGTPIPVCPEVYGGMTTPRIPSERVKDRVLNKNGEDVTACFQRGSVEMLKLAKLCQCKYALLKENSPSCGHGTIYDGTFTGTLTKGDGVFAQMLIENGIHVFGETEADEFIDILKKVPKRE